MLYLTGSGERAPTGARRIALVNNMPDTALEDTERQFTDLLARAATGIDVRLALHALPAVPRSERALALMQGRYRPVADLMDDGADGIIVTGTEPQRPDLRDEPYWSELGDLLDWAADETRSTVLSCLAAHAAVLHRDGIGRHPLPVKQWGVFDFRTTAHPLTEGLPSPLRMPHSRWNEVQADALAACGYRILADSADAGVDLFVKEQGRSLFVHFQGHPEYGPETLLKEYRRDIRRHVRGERPTYPPLPHGYVDAPDAVAELAAFRERVTARPTEETLATFPDTAVAATLTHAWRPAATAVYRNWLRSLAAA